MVIDITELITVKKISFNALLNWLDFNAGRYIGQGTGISMERLRSDIQGQIIVLEIGHGWQIEVYVTVDCYGRTLHYQLDIDNEQAATFFILKFL